MHKKDSSEIEAIDFDSSLQTPENAEAQEKKRNHSTLILFAFLALILSAVVVFIFLPDYVAKKNITPLAKKDPEKTQPTDKPANETVEVPDALETNRFTPEELAAFKLEAEKLLLQIIEKQTLLENKAIEKWANDEYTLATSLGAEGDEFFRTQVFNQAVESYKNSLAILTDLENKIQPTLEIHLLKGEQALAQAEKISALHHFELANAIDKDNLQARNGLKRAETIEELFSLLEKGGKYEAANRFGEAKNTYQQATTLDPLSKEAKEALDRVSSRLTQLEFDRLIHQGHASLKLGQYNDAKSAFHAAQKLLPSSNEAKQGLASVAQAVRNQKLRILFAEAQHFESLEDWSNAADSYQQALQLAANSEKAKSGLQANQHKQDVLSRLNEFNASPLRLGTKTVADDANKLLQQVSAISNSGNNIQQAALKLEQLLVVANQPISITIQSDDQTDVVIYKIGKFGKFSNKQIDLKPGKYTLVGSRAGFRDVRKVLAVTADMSSRNIQIQCDEPI